MGDILNGCIALSSTELPLPARTQPLWNPVEAPPPALSGANALSQETPKICCQEYVPQRPRIDQKIQNSPQCSEKAKNDSVDPKKKKNYGRIKITFLRKFVKLTEGQYWPVNIFGLCFDTFCACDGRARKDGAEGWVALHYNRPRATSGIHGVAGRVRYRLCQYRGGRKSMPSPCQVADVPPGQLEIKCFNILVSQTTSRIS